MNIDRHDFGEARLFSLKRQAKAKLALARRRRHVHTALACVITAVLAVLAGLLIKQFGGSLWVALLVPALIVVIDLISRVVD